MRWIHGSVAALMVLALMVAVEAAAGQEASPVAGRWQGAILVTKGPFEFQGKVYVITMVCHQDGQKVVCVANGAFNARVDGKLEGTSLQLRFLMIDSGNPNLKSEFNLEGTLTKPGLIEGMVKGIGDNSIREGTFTGVKY